MSDEWEREGVFSRCCPCDSDANDGEGEECDCICHLTEADWDRHDEEMQGL